MPIIDKVGRKKPAVRMFIVLLYILLTLGAITMVYPFLLMLSSSVTSEVDKNEYKIIPRYLYDDELLLQKYLYDKYNGCMVSNLNYPALNEVYGTDYLTWDEIQLPEIDLTNSKVQLRIKDCQKFRERLPEKYKVVVFLSLGGSTGKIGRLYQRALEKRFRGDIKELNRVYIEEHESFLTVVPPDERYLARIWQPEENAWQKEWKEFKMNLPEEYKIIVSGDGIWQEWLKTRYDKDINLLNEKWTTGFRSFSEMHLSPVLPEDKDMQSDWIKFMKERFPLHYLKVTGGNNEYHKFLDGKYAHNINYINKLYGTGYNSFDEIPIPELGGKLLKGIVLSDWGEFVKEKLPAEYMEAENAENLYREFLKGKYGNLKSINASYGTDYNTFLEISPPYRESDYLDLMEHKTSWKRYFLIKNYITVIDYILLHGRAVHNTVIFCIIVIITTLTVNPLCAFALSRFNLKATNKILLFLLATMAFPAEVSLIPNFLLLKQFHMLNTFWALILPGMASGFSIFLLKGFFDSLPKELYEAGAIDGASEFRMLYQITIPLAKPVLAYLALGAFTSAYGAFMFALIVCQNPKMWTIMVWLYQMQDWAPSFVQMAAFTLATVPTLLVFVFAQRVIMSGIILPVEH